MTESISRGLMRSLPRPSTCTRQALIVDADPEATYAAIRTTDLADSWAVTALSTLRMIPDRVLARLRRRPTRPVLGQATLVDLIDSGYWVVLEERAPRELVLGLVMWDERMNRDGASRELFEDPGPGSVRVGWSFTVEPLSDGRSLLVTETRTEPVDAGARSRFRLYWSLISPFASLTRWLVLRAIARHAAAAEPSGDPTGARIRVAA